jgi:hypothetical protein
VKILVEADKLDLVPPTPMPSRNRPPDKISRHAACVATSDALAPLGVTDLPMPATPERIWRAIREHTRS